MILVASVNLLLIGTYLAQRQTRIECCGLGSPANVIATASVGHIFKYIGVLLVFSLVSASGTLLYAQTIGIKIVNGRNGSPLSGKCVNVWVGHERKEALAIPTDSNGVATLRLTHKDSEVDVHNQWKACGYFGVKDPVVKYSDSLEINVGYVRCQTQTADYSWLSQTEFSMEQVIDHGVVTPNSCGKATASPKPGEVILFVRPLTWWEKMKD